VHSELLVANALVEVADEVFRMAFKVSFEVLYSLLESLRLVGTKKAKSFLPGSIIHQFLMRDLMLF
jgi:hypothetical protein